MYNKLRLKDVMVNNENNFNESIVKLIDYKVFHQDKDFQLAFEESLEDIQLLMLVNGGHPDKEISNDLLELIIIMYEEYKINRRRNIILERIANK